jgi:AcrR family transcriptional regulator
MVQRKFVVVQGRRSRLVAESGTGRRSYRSQLRESQARATRRAVVAAAAELFVRDGYAATTLEDVAAAAGVSRSTVVNVAGGKATLLHLAWDWSLVGDDEPVPMAARPVVQRIEATTDPAEAVRLWAEMVVEVAGRAAPIGRVLEVAADTDREAAELLATADAERHQGARDFARHLDRTGGLAPGLSVRRAADLLWLHNDPRLYRRLVVERGWSPREFADWLVRAVTASVLGAEPPLSR